MADPYIYNPLNRATYEAIAYNAIGRASEIGTFPRYDLQHSTGNSGWSIGMIQTDLSSNTGHAQTVSTMLSNYQAWAPTQQRFTAHELSSLSHRLQIGGQSGNALTDDEHSRLNAYLRSDNGRTFVGGLDSRQIDREWQRVGQPLSQVPWLQNLSASDPAKAAEIVTMASKLYNQNEIRGTRLIQHLQQHELTSAQTHDWIGNQGIHGLTAAARSAIVSGRDNALTGIQLMNRLELGNGPLSRSWHQEVHVKGDADLTANFNNNPNAQLLDAMMRDPVNGARIFAHTDNGAAAQAITIRGASAAARLEMSHITLDQTGRLAAQSAAGDHFALGTTGWSRNGALMIDQSDLEHTTNHPPQQATDMHQHQILKLGTKGDNIAALQGELARMDYVGRDRRPLESDGNFGAHTRFAVEAFQRDQHIPVDGQVGPETRAAIDHAIPTQSHQGSLPLSNPRNADNDLYKQALAGVEKIDEGMGRTPDHYSANLAAALVPVAKASGITRIDTVALSVDGSYTFAVQNATGSHQIARVNTADAVQTPIETSSDAAQAAVLPATQTTASSTLHPASSVQHDISAPLQ